MNPWITTGLFERPYTGICRDASISDCTRYRYWLKRWWDEDEVKPWACFIMLNPSTADAAKDDPTIRRCVSFARAWDCAGLFVVNLFAWRATDPKDLVAAGMLVGDENDWHIKQSAKLCKGGPVVAAWGAHAKSEHRAAEVRGYLADRGASLQCLGLTKDGHPRHPLYVPASASLQLFAPLSPSARERREVRHAR